MLVLASQRERRGLESCLVLTLRPYWSHPTQVKGAGNYLVTLVFLKISSWRSD